MQVSTHIGYGTITSVYRMAAGEKIAWHKHPVPHTTAVAAGRSECEIRGGEAWQMRPGDRDRELPADIEHEIRAVEDGTIVVNIIAHQPDISVDAGHGGVRLEDGTVIYDQT